MKFTLPDRVISLWPFSLEAPPEVLSVYRRLLAPDETARALRFKFEHLQHSFTLTHGALRLLLGRFLGIPAASVTFHSSERGKPGVPGPIRFNLSHSGKVALYGFTLDCEIGVDVEQNRPRPGLLTDVAQYFCPEEAEEIRSLSPPEDLAAFYRCWTRKEAYLKATGDGLYTPLDSFRVSLLPGSQPRLIHVRTGEEEARQWTLHSIDSLHGYTAAVAYRDAPRILRLEPLTSPQELLALAKQDEF